MLNRREMLGTVAGLAASNFVSRIYSRSNHPWNKPRDSYNEYMNALAEREQIAASWLDDFGSKERIFPGSLRNYAQPSDEPSQIHMGVILENQWKFNKNWAEDADKSDHYRYGRSTPYWQAAHNFYDFISIPLIQGSYYGAVNNFFNTWSMLSPVDSIFWEQDGVYSEQRGVAATTRICSYYPRIDEGSLEGAGFASVQRITTLQILLAQRLYRWAMTVMSRQAPNIKTNSLGLRDAIYEAMKSIRTLGNVEPTYLVASQEVCRALGATCVLNNSRSCLKLRMLANRGESCEPVKIGKVCGMDLWEDPLMDYNEAFMGHKAGPCSGGYTIAYYTPLTIFEVTNGVHQLATRYGHTMRKDGQYLYHTISLE